MFVFVIVTISRDLSKALYLHNGANIVNSGEFAGLKRNNETTSENQTIFAIRGQSKFRKLPYSNHFLPAFMKEIYALFCCQLFFVVFTMFFFVQCPQK